MADLLEPKDEEFLTLKGETKTYVLSKFPAVAGREIVAGYPTSAIPKVADYKDNEAIMLKLMCYVAVKHPNGTLLRLVTSELVNNHVPDYETLLKIEIAMMKYNTSFFGQGEVSTFLGAFVKKVLVSASPTLTTFSERLLEVVRQRGANYETTTH
jgi:hypothetical protein